MSVCDCCNLQGTVRIQGSVEGPVAWSDYHLAKLLTHLTAVFSWPTVVTRCSDLLALSLAGRTNLLRALRRFATPAARGNLWVVTFRSCFLCLLAYNSV